MIGDCPLCSKAKHLYVNIDKGGVWDCKRCGEGGSLFALADAVGVRVRDEKPAIASAFKVLSSSSARRKPKDAPGVSLEKVNKACEKVFDDDNEKGALVRAYLHGRGFDDETIKHFQLGVAAMSTPKGRMLGVGMPFIEDGKVTLIKMRNLAKAKGERLFSRTKGGESNLFNVEGIKNCKRVVLVEAELDAVSLWQLGITNVAAMSIGAKKDIPPHWRLALEDAEEIIIWFDDDSVGQEAADVLAQSLGEHRCRIASFEGSKAQEAMAGTLNDANDLLRCIVDGGIEEDTVKGWAAEIVADAKAIENTTVVAAGAFAEIIELDIEKGEQLKGVSTGWPSLDNLVLGWRLGELTMVTGHTNHGKSTWLTAAMDKLAQGGEPVLTSAFEGGPVSLARKLFQRRFKRPLSSLKTDADKLAAKEALVRLDEFPVYIIDKYGEISIEELEAIIVYAAKRLHIRFMMIDHLHYALKRPRGVDEREYLDLVSKRLKDLTTELNIHIFLVCHPNGAVSTSAIPTHENLKGSSSIKQNADNSISVFRAMDLFGDPTPRKMKLRDGQDNRVEVEISPLNSLVYVSKIRFDGAKTGACIFDFQANDLSYFDPRSLNKAGDQGDDVDEEIADPFAELPF